MATYEYKCKECNTEYDVVQSMKDDKYKEYNCPKCEKTTPCERLISYSGPAIWIGGAPTTSSVTRGYGGRFGNKIRPAGSPVDAPANKAEADRQFSSWVDNGGLTGIKPSFTVPTQTTEQQLDRSYKPK
jgi:putative FmdB family regulatory protein